jgi:betaine-aldehyde dehydrogenase
MPAANSAFEFTTLRLPEPRGLYYAGAWHAPLEGGFGETINPGTGESLGRVAEASAADVDAAVEAALRGFAIWRLVPPLERARLLRQLAAILRDRAQELAMLDAADCGNPVREMVGDVMNAADQIDFFAGLVTEMKGASVPMGPDAINFSLRGPLGVVARIVPFNHPLMFCAGKAAAPLAAGNSVIVKPPERAPLSGLRLAQLTEAIFPAGVFNVLTGGPIAGAALASHPGVAKVAIIGSVATGRAALAAGAATIKPAMLELGGKNALIAYPDAAADDVAAAIVSGMNFTWCGQSCGSTSRAFVHRDLYAAVLARIPALCARFRPGLPTDPSTTMGAIVSKEQYDRVMNYIETAKAEGGRLVCGGKRPDDAALAGGWFVEPTVFADVSPQMTIAREEIFGPVCAVFHWEDEAEMLRTVNASDYGLTCSIWTNDISTALRAAGKVEAGFVWINEVSKHFLGTPFGGYKQSGSGREECLGELLAFTQEKNIHVKLRR